ncbi:MAG: hypothetical protein SGILL_010279, partial [Bacillariaceae sp.]
LSGVYTKIDDSEGVDDASSAVTIESPKDKVAAIKAIASSGHFEFDVDGVVNTHLDVDVATDTTSRLNATQKRLASGDPARISFGCTNFHTMRIKQILALLPLAFGHVSALRMLDQNNQTIASSIPGKASNKQDSVFAIEDQDPASIFQLVSPSVASLDVYSSIRKGLNAKLWWMSLRNLGREIMVGSSCTGFLWNEVGHDDDHHYLITAAHCVVNSETKQQAKVIRVKFPLVSDYLEAIIVGADCETDIAVLKIEDSRWILGLGDFLPQAIPMLQPSSSTIIDDVQPGQPCMVIGKMEQNRNSVWTGTISAVGMTFISNSGGHEEYGTIESDELDMMLAFFSIVRLVPGGSGSPLLNREGHVIGVGTGSREDKYLASTSTAVPAGIALRVANQIVEFGRSIKPSIGATLLCDNVQMANEANGWYQFGGAVIVNIAKNGPAKSAGLKGLGKNDAIHHIITEVDGKQVRGKGDFYSVLLTKAPGDILQLTVRDYQVENAEGAETVVEIEVCSHDDMKYPRAKRNFAKP